MRLDPAQSDSPSVALTPMIAEVAAPGVVRPSPTFILPLLFFRRIGVALIQLAVVSLLVFIVLRLLPADPLALLAPAEASHEDVAAMREALGLDRPITTQYGIWLRDALGGDLGRSNQLKQPVLDLILSALPMTLELVFAGLFIGVSLGFGMALASFYWRGGVFERAIEVVASLSQSIPEFLWAILLILAFGLGLQLLPFIGPINPQFVVPSRTGFLLIDTLLSGQLDAFFSRLTHLVLPGLALGLGKAPLIVRILRSSLIEAYTEEYVYSARLRGLSERRILFAHALRNAVLPTISLLGVQAGFIFGGTLLIEAIYSFPGLGNLMISAVRFHDLPLIQGITLTYCMVVLLMNTLVDLIYVWLNPRLRAQ
jgi:ABC-type dipeptide/oligopeptide/nickel transport system permease component